MQATVRLLSGVDDGLSVEVPCSLLVADSHVLRSVLATCRAVDTCPEVTVAGVAGSTLGQYKELLGRGEVRVSERSSLDTLQQLLDVLGSRHRDLTQLVEAGVGQEEAVTGGSGRERGGSRPRRGQEMRNPDAVEARSNNNNNNIREIFRSVMKGSGSARGSNSRTKELRRKSAVTPPIVASTPNLIPPPPMEFERRISVNLQKDPIYGPTGVDMERERRKSKSRDRDQNIAAVKTETFDDNRMMSDQLDMAGYDEQNGVEVLAFACQICLKTFSRIQDRKAHVAKCHNDAFKKTFSCPKCSCVIKSKSALIAHVKTCDGRPYHLGLENGKWKCEKCQKKFHSKRILKDHSCGTRKRGKRNTEVFEKHLKVDAGAGPVNDSRGREAEDTEETREDASRVDDPDETREHHYYCESCPGSIHGKFNEETAEKHRQETGHEMSRVKIPRFVKL